MRTGQADGCRAQLIWTVAGIRRCQVQDRKSPIPVGRAQTTTTVDQDPEKARRQTELIRYAYQLLTLPVLSNDLRSAFGEIEKRSQELLERGRAAQFVDKGTDSGGVARLVEQFQEAITHYRVSENHSVGPSATHTVG